MHGVEHPDRCPACGDDLYTEHGCSACGHGKPSFVARHPAIPVVLAFVVSLGVSAALVFAVGHQAKNGPVMNLVACFAGAVFHGWGMLCFVRPSSVKSVGHTTHLGQVAGATQDATAGQAIGLGIGVTLAGLVFAAVGIYMGALES